MASYLSVTVADSLYNLLLIGRLLVDQWNGLSKKFVQLKSEPSVNLPCRNKRHLIKFYYPAPNFVDFNRRMEVVF